MSQCWREERTDGCTKSNQTPCESLSLFFCYSVINYVAVWHIPLIKNKCHTCDPCISLLELSISLKCMCKTDCCCSLVEHIMVQIAFGICTPRMLCWAYFNPVVQVHANILIALFFDNTPHCWQLSVEMNNSFYKTVDIFLWRKAPNLQNEFDTEPPRQNYSMLR